MPKLKANYREATEIEVQRAIAVAKCKFFPGSFAKRFARDLKAQVTSTHKITEAQARRLVIQCYIFRRQIQDESSHLVPLSPPEGYETPTRQREMEFPKNV
jgi:hypothetical protein